jgi:hypothetical protein
MDIVVTKDDFCILADIVIVNPTCIDLVQSTLSMIMHATTIVAQDKT